MESPHVVIIGAGASGIGLAIQLKRAGLQSFTLLEKSDDLGGVWHENTYPGAACDVPSHLYSYSFALKKDWSRKYARQEEIHRYFRDCATRFGISEHIRFNSTVIRAEFDESESVWRVLTADGKTRVANILVNAIGQLNRPRLPSVPGLDSFRGIMFHSARWNHDFDLSGLRVAVIGNGASGAQLVPSLAPKAKQLLVFQRSPNWICPFRDSLYPPLLRRLFAHLPGFARICRWWHFWQLEWRVVFNGKQSFQNRLLTAFLRWQMQRRLPPALWSDLIPSYPAGCRRILLSNDYLESLQRENVELITDSIDSLESGSIRAGGKSHEIDAVVLATGFETDPLHIPFEILGKCGQSLEESWGTRPLTFLGLVTPGFPNFFMLYGPNTNLAHNSILFMVECQIHYLVACLKRMIREKDRTIEIRRNAAEHYDERLQHWLQKTVWTGPCSSWYKNEAGEVVNNWSSPVLKYWFLTRRPRFRDFLRTPDNPTESNQEAALEGGTEPTLPSASREE
jgi:cation diffusion facilitator CzcD-associated flavoprotein CzcO